MAVNGTSIVIVLAGATLAYSGVKGKSITSTVQAFLRGQNPGDIPTNPKLALTADTSSAVATTTADASPTGVATTDGGNATVVAAARSQLGKPYVWDTPLSWSDPNPRTFDCSGLSGWCYARAGVKNLTHFTGTQYAFLGKRPLSQAQPGDLVFWALGGSGIPYHVAIYIGGMQVIEAPDVGIPVRVRAITLQDSDIMQNVGAFPG